MSSQKLFSTKFGEWEAQFDEKLIYPSLAFTDKLNTSKVSRFAKTQVDTETVTLRASPKAWKLNKPQGVSNDITIEEESLAPSEDQIGEQLIRNQLREDYRKRIAYQNRHYLSRDVVDMQKVATVVHRRLRAPAQQLNPLSKESDPLDIYEVLSSKRITSKKAKETVESVLYDKHKSLLEKVAEDDPDRILDGILHYRVSHDLTKRKETLSDSKIAQTFVRSLTAFRSKESQPRDQSLEVLTSPLDLVRAKRALEFNQTGYEESVDDQTTSLTTYDADKRNIQDRLLISQIKLGVLPINLLRRDKAKAADTEFGDTEAFPLDISNYSIGDDHGICIGESLAGVHTVQSINLRNNRLTRISLPTVISNMSTESLKMLDISCNSLLGADTALGDFFLAPNALEKLNVSECRISNNCVKNLFRSLCNQPNQLKSINLSRNGFSVEGAASIQAFLVSSTCTLRSLNISGNEIGSIGGKMIADALSKNDSVEELDVSANGLPDEAGQLLINNLGSNKVLKTLNLSHNKISSRSCFVLAKVLRHEHVLQNIDLSENPLGEPGARCLFREFLVGTDCHIDMSDSTFDIDDSVFNYTNPETQLPYYTLNLAVPFDAAIFDELLSILIRRPSVQFSSVLYRQASNFPELNYILSAVNGEIMQKSSGGWNKWVPFTEGTLKVTVTQRVVVPTLSMVLPSNGFKTLVDFLLNVSSSDRSKFMKLLFHDIFCLTSQVREMLNALEDRKILIRAGDITTKDVFLNAWSHIIDSAHKFELVFEYFPSKEERKDLAKSLSFEQYRFSWDNATGYYNLNLANETQYEVMQQLSAINTVESELGQAAAKRNERLDTSQKGNWFNFRNEVYKNNEMCIGIDFLNNLPRQGRISFDYISTVRPSTAVVETISMEELATMLQNLGISRTKRLDILELAFILMELQIASARYYFTVEDVGQVIDAFLTTFHRDSRVYSKVVVALFSRIYDLHNFDAIMRTLPTEASHEVSRKLGYLNIINPLKLSHQYVLPMKYLDNRILLVMLMNLSSSEGGEQIRMAANTDISLVNLYGRIHRIIQITSWKETTSLAYSELGEQTKQVSWSSRKELIKKFLLGSHPFHPELFKVIDMYTELEAANALDVGPIDRQYKDFVTNRFGVLTSALSKLSDVGSA